MSTSVDTLKFWLDQGNTGEYSHMIVATDSFDYEDYPIYVSQGDNPEAHRPSNGDRVMECYSYGLPLAQQLAESRANHWELPTQGGDS